MYKKLRYLLLQVRNQDDPIRLQEVRCFADALRCEPAQIQVFDLLSGPPDLRQLGEVDLVLLGGSGHYSVAQGGPWLEGALEGMRELYEMSKPTFASCWGFQAMARAMGGEVVTDLSRAELGTHALTLTPAGRQDPLFASVSPIFLGHMGHQDIVEQLPDDAVLLASTAGIKNQAFRFADKPIYCTQFHPELTVATMAERLVAYPNYVEKISGMTMDAFIGTLTETPEMNHLLARFVEQVFGS